MTFTLTSCFSLLFSGTLHLVRYTSPFLPCFLLLLFPQLFLSLPQTTTLPFCISFSCGWFWSMPHVQYYKLSSIVLQAFCLPELISWIYSSPPQEIWFRLYLNGLVVFSALFSLSLNFAIRSWWFEPHSAPGLVFADCIELLHLQLQRMWSVWFQYWPSGDVHV